MISLDTNILFPALEPGHGDHKSAVAFFESLADRRDVVISEFILLELYGLLRNPAILRRNPRNASGSSRNWLLDRKSVV